MAIKLTITNPKTKASVSVSLNASEAEQPIEFRNTAMADVPNMDSAIVQAYPFVTYRAIESACVSGVIYARRKLGLSGLKIELLSYSFTGAVENAEPFAIAVMMGGCQALLKPVQFSSNEMNGWQEVAATC